MRYYDIIISKPDSNEVVKRYTSYANGKNIPGALNIILDIPVVAFASPMGAGYVQIWGIGIADISQASDLNNMSIAVYAGMQKGLPLANPQQAGLIVQGTIFQAFGNWVNTEQTLDLVIQPSTGSARAPKNLILNWKKDTPLSEAIENVLSTAFPDYKRKINISPDLKLSQNEQGYYQNLTQFAQYIKQVSKDIRKNQDYAGVDIMLTQTEFTVSDGTTVNTPKKIAFQDMIGQPTWINPLAVQVKFVMRADLHIGDSIQFPQAVATVSQQGNSPFLNAKSIFQGVFQINQIRHVGNFRQSDAASWVSTVDSFSTKAAA